MLESILEAGTWAPSPLNMQGWEFIVITSRDVKEMVFDEAERCRRWALEKSGWKWIDSYNVDFLKQAPVMIVVVGDPKKTGVDMFMDEGMAGYQSACAAAIQNIHLAAHSFGLGSLWFTLFDKKALRGILEISDEKTPFSYWCYWENLGPSPRLCREKCEGQDQIHPLILNIHTTHGCDTS